MARWVWLEAVSWDESRWRSGSITLAQLIDDLHYLLDGMRHSPLDSQALLDRVQADLLELARCLPLDDHHGDRTIEVDRLLQRCADLAYRSR